MPREGAKSPSHLADKLFRFYRSYWHFYYHTQELTRLINANNESAVASKAQQSGGHLAVVKAPVLAPADQKQKGKSAKASAEL